MISITKAHSKKLLQNLQKEQSTIKTQENLFVSYFFYKKHKMPMILLEAEYNLLKKHIDFEENIEIKRKNNRFILIF